MTHGIIREPQEQFWTEWLEADEWNRKRMIEKLVNIVYIQYLNHDLKPGFVNHLHRHFTDLELQVRRRYVPGS